MGDDCAIAARHCIDTLSGEDGIRIDEEGVGFVKLADHLVDFWDVQVGTFPQDVGPSRFHGENSQSEWIKKIRPYTDKPIVGVGRFTSPDAMVAVIKSGQQDIIGAGRPSISDPFRPNKIYGCRMEEIRRVHWMYVCASRDRSRIICTQKAVTGENIAAGGTPSS